MAYTAEEREELLDILYEQHRDAYNFRPGTAYMEAARAMTDEQLDALMQEMSEAVQRAIDEDKRAEAEAAKRFEAMVVEITAKLGVDRRTFIRWDMDARGAVDADHYKYLNGLGYDYKLYESNDWHCPAPWENKLMGAKMYEAFVGGRKAA